MKAEIKEVEISPAVPAVIEKQVILSLSVEEAEELKETLKNTGGSYDVFRTLYALPLKDKEYVIEFKCYSSMEWHRSGNDGARDIFYDRAEAEKACQLQQEQSNRKNTLLTYRVREL